MSSADRPPPGEARIALMTPQQKRRIGSGAAVCLTLGLIAVLGVVSGSVALAARIACAVLGGLFILLGLLALSALGRSTPRREIVVDAWGLRHEAQSSGAWAVQWDEIGACEVVQGFHAARGVSFVKTYRVRLVLYPADPQFAERHPEMQALATLAQWSAPGGYVLPLGPARELVAPLSQALATYGQWRFRGFRDEGRVSNGYL